jgi:hypothetical protein
MVSLKVWGLVVAKRRGMQKALVAVARKLAIVLHRMWLAEKDFRWSGVDPVSWSGGTLADQGLASISCS